MLFSADMRSAFAFALVVLALVGCGASMDSGSSTLADAAQDGANDAGSDTGAGGCSGCLGARLEWELNGGLVAYRDRSAILPCNTYQRQRFDPPSGTIATAQCTAMLGHCGADAASGAPTIEAVAAAVADPEVQAALARAPLLFGVDPRPYDGQVLRITMGGAQLEVGDGCGAQAGCTEAPAGVATLVSLLRALDEHEATTTSCAQFR